MIRLTVGVVYTTISPIPTKVAQMLDDRLRYLSANATPYNPAYASGRWDGFVRMYERQYGRFPTGLLIRVKRIFDEEGIDYEVVPELPGLPQTTTRRYQPKHILRPYQQEAVAAAVKSRRGILSIPTGGGKTEIAQAIIHETGVNRIVFLVHSRSLLIQTVRRMREAFPEATVIQWGDGKRPDISVPDEYILVSTVQSAFKAAHPLLSEAGMVFVDESHHQSAETFKTCTKACAKARYLIGLSATAFRSDGADLELEAWIGPIIYRVPYDHLIENGWLVPPTFHLVYTLNEALTLTQGKKTLIFSEKWEDIRQFRETFDRHKVVMVSSKTRDLKGVMRDFAAGTITHIVTTPMFDEGLDIPDIDAVVFFATCGSRTRAIQRIGRGMRLAPGKKEMLVVDLLDDKYQERLQAYRKEPAFASRL